MKHFLSILIMGLATVGLASETTKIAAEKMARAQKEVNELASDPKLIAFVKNHNSQPDKSLNDLTNAIWSKMSTRDPLVKLLANNEAAKLLKNWARPYVSEAFVSGKDGTKVAFINKTSNWTHKGNPKHEVPMTGKTWTGPIELDKSSGVNQFQVSAPIVFNGEPIGSVVVGFSLVKFL